MSDEKELEIVTATLDVSIFVDCPNDKCGNLINLLDERDTDNTTHNDDGYLLRQVWPKNGSHDDFECEEVVCSKCKTEFNVKALEW